MSSLAAISSFVRTPSCSRRFAVAIFLAVIFLGRPRSVMIKILPRKLPDFMQHLYLTQYCHAYSPSGATSEGDSVPPNALHCFDDSGVNICQLSSVSLESSRHWRQVRRSHVAPALFTVHLPPESRHVRGLVARVSPRRTFRTLADGFVALRHVAGTVVGHDVGSANRGDRSCSSWIALNDKPRAGIDGSPG